MPRKAAAETPRPRTKKKERAPIVCKWASSSIVFGLDSRDRKENSEYHPPIALTSDGKFVDESNQRDLDPSEVPAYIREAAKHVDLNDEWTPPKKRMLTYSEAMSSAGVKQSPIIRE